MDIGGNLVTAAAEVFVGWLGRRCAWPKIEGVGFRNLHGFNLAFLGKHV